MDSILNLDMLLENSYTPAVNNIDFASINESYYREAIDYCTEMSNQYKEANRQLYKSLLESGDNQEAINESFSDFTDKVKEIIDKFLAFIKKICAKFNTAMHKLVQSDKYLTKNKKKFEKFDSEDEFEMNLFNFTFLEDNSFPQITPYTTFTRSINNNQGGTQNPAKYATDTTGDKVLEDIRASYKDYTENLSDWYEKFRGEVLGETNASYTAAEYNDKLFEKFRDNENTKTSTTVTYDLVQTSLTRFSGYTKHLNQVKKLQSDLEKEYNRIKKEIKNIEVDFTTNDIGDNGYSGYNPVVDIFGAHSSDPNFTTAYEKKKKDIDAVAKSIISAKVNQIDHMCKIHALAFTAKLDAIKDQYKQDKKLLYGALSRIEKHYYKNESAIPEYLDTMVHEEYNNIVSDFRRDYAYNNYLLTESINQQTMLSYVAESVALESGNVGELTYIHESLVDSIKNILKKIMETIKRLWNKFLERAGEMLTTNDAWLKKYKSIIINNPFKEHDIEMYKYDENQFFNMCSKASQIVFNSEIFNKLCELDSDDEDAVKKYFMDKHYPDMKNLTEQDNLDEMFLERIRGDSTVDMKMTELSKDSIYEFCASYSKKTIPELSKAQQNTDKIAGQIEAEIQNISSNIQSVNKQVKDAVSKDESKKGDVVSGAKNVLDRYKVDLNDKSGGGKDTYDASTKTATASTKPSEKHEQTIIYSSLYEGTIIVSEDGTTPPNPAPAPSNPTPASPNKPEENKSNGGVKISAAKDNMKENDGAAMARTAAANSVTANDSEELQNLEAKFKKASNNTPKYMRLHGQVFTALMTVAANMYKDYMKILQTHVRDYVGVKKKTETK